VVCIGAGVLTLNRMLRDDGNHAFCVSCATVIEDWREPCMSLRRVSTGHVATKDVRNSCQDTSELGADTQDSTSEPTLMGGTCHLCIVIPHKSVLTSLRFVQDFVQIGSRQHLVVLQSSKCLTKGPGKWGGIPRLYSSMSRCISKSDSRDVLQNVRQRKNISNL
jgi:hypothetical protein